MSKKLSHRSDNPENKEEEVVKKREFQEEMAKLNIDQIINDVDPNSIQLTKLRQLKINLAAAVSKKPIDHRLKMLMNKDKAESDLIKRNINNAEKMLS